MHTKFQSENLKRRDCTAIPRHRGDLKEVECEGVNWIHLTQDRDQWYVLVNVVLNINYIHSH
jgi:hypothetical protein